MALAQHDRLRQRLEDSVGDAARFVGTGDPFDDDHEFVAAEAGQRVAGSDGSKEAVRHDAKELVPDLVPEVVVDHLEAVDVAE